MKNYRNPNDLPFCQINCLKTPCFVDRNFSYILEFGYISRKKTKIGYVTKLDWLLYLMIFARLDCSKHSKMTKNDLKNRENVFIVNMFAVFSEGVKQKN